MSWTRYVLCAVLSFFAPAAVSNAKELRPADQKATVLYEGECYARIDLVRRDGKPIQKIIVLRRLDCRSITAHLPDGRGRFGRPRKNPVKTFKYTIKNVVLLDKEGAVVDAFTYNGKTAQLENAYSNYVHSPAEGKFVKVQDERFGAKVRQCQLALVQIEGFRFDGLRCVLKTNQVALRLPKDKDLDSLPGEKIEWVVVPRITVQQEVYRLGRAWWAEATSHFEDSLIYRYDAAAGLKYYMTIRDYRKAKERDDSVIDAWYEGFKERAREAGARGRR